MSNQTLDVGSLMTGKDGQLFVTGADRNQIFLAEVDSFKAQISFANADFLVELTGTLTGRDSQVIIAPKDMAAKYLDIASDGASFMRILFIGVLPVGCLAVGAFVFLRRRHL